jgi:hypothetical protein
MLKCVVFYFTNIFEAFAQIDKIVYNGGDGMIIDCIN